MSQINNLSPAPVLVDERVLDDRATIFGKQIVERDFRMSDGSVLPVLCVINLGMSPVIVFALTERRTVFLVNQFRFGINGWVLELPGGCPKPGQNWEDATRAELLEEIGAEARDVKVIGEMALNPVLGDICFSAVLATGCRVVCSQDLDSTETMTVVEVSINEFREMLKKGEITDAKTVAVGYLALDHLGLLG
jgi:ADP-ribose pyrophosphatase